MKRFPFFDCLLLLLLGFIPTLSFAQTISLRIIGTSDVHGNYLDYDYLSGTRGKGGLARVATYVRQQREALGADHVVLVDNGDILQGQPAAYYYNFVDTKSEHLCASVLNALNYDVGVPGNHDIETGHAVYDRWASQCNHPIVCANVTDTRLGNSYWPPYTIVQRGKVRIAVVGMLTPTVPKWLPAELWSGMAFEDMAQTARRYVAEIKDKQLADVIIGVFHSGMGDAADEGSMIENASQQVARLVPDFDLIICGHDHRAAVRRVAYAPGKNVLMLNPGAGASNVAVADITLERRSRQWKVVNVSGNLVDVGNLSPDRDFVQTFEKQHRALLAYIEKPVVTIDTTITTCDAFWGANAFVDLIHRLQLRLTQADISFAAPLSFDAVLKEGTLCVRDMFQLYRYENRLYTMQLSGDEIVRYLEKSYDGWVRTMSAPTDTMLRFRPHPQTYKEGWQRLATSSYNFDSAAGIYYTVDLRKGKGERVHIERLTDGRTFCKDSLYVVAVNSYRANGGGDLLTEGVGIAKSELPARILSTSTHDLRHYMMAYLQRVEGTLHLDPLRHWRFVPEEWAREAQSREKSLLFPQ